MRLISGTTRTAAVIGSPVRHSRSPLLANAAFEAAGMDWVLVALEVPAGAGAGAVQAARSLGLGGLMVTMPHKEAVIPALDRLTPAAAALRSVNSIAWEGDELVGDSTDGAGLVASLLADDIGVAGRTCVVLGAGGAARSVVWALAEAGVERVLVVNRTAEHAHAAAVLAGIRGGVGEPDDVANADLVVNATSVGMGVSAAADGPLPVDSDLLRPGQVVVDLVYQPLETPLLRAARAAGAHPVDGLGMLVHQAALSIRRWTGADPDLAAMSLAARQP